VNEVTNMHLTSSSLADFTRSLNIHRASNGTLSTTSALGNRQQPTAYIIQSTISFLSTPSNMACPAAGKVRFISNGQSRIQEVAELILFDMWSHIT